MPGDRISNRDYLQLIVLFLIPLLIIIFGITGFPYLSPEAIYSDLAISHFPNALYLKQALIKYRSIPLWSSTILSGYPFFANPLSGLWYPPGWLALAFPLPMGFNLIVVLHLLFGGLGLYRLLRQLEIGHLAAVFGGMAFLSMPKIFAQYGAGHLTLVYAVCWTPWLFLSVKGQGSGFKDLWGGIVLALIFLADPRWAPFAGLLWFAYVLAHRQNRGAEILTGVPSIFKHKFPVANLQYLVSNIFLAALLSSPLAIPLLEYSRLSTRSALQPEDVFAHSLPPARLLGLMYPDLAGYHEWVIYLGGVVLALIVVAMIAGRPRRSIIFWGIAFLGALIFTLGSNFPLLAFVAKIPGMNLLRVPARALFLVGISGAVLAAFGIESLIHSEVGKENKRLKLSLAGISSFSLFIALGVSLLTGEWAFNFLWGAASFLLATLWILTWPRTRLPRQTWFAGLLLLSLFDWSIVNVSLISFRDSHSVFSEGQKVASFLESDEHIRIYSPSYSVPQQTAARNGLELADGVDPMQIAAYADFMVPATGIPSDGYSVTLPPFANGEPKTANQNFIPDAKQLGLLNVAYVVSDFDLKADGLVFEAELDGRQIYSNQFRLPRAWVQPDLDEIFFEVAPAEVLEWRPNYIEILANGPGKLVLSEIYYPGWQVTVDGKPAEIDVFHGVLRSVHLEKESQLVEFSFKPITVYVGLSLCALGIFWLFWARINDRKQP